MTVIKACNQDGERSRGYHEDGRDVKEQYYTVGVPLSVITLGPRGHDDNDNIKRLVDIYIKRK